MCAFNFISRTSLTKMLFALSASEADWPLRPAALRGLRSLSAPDTPRQRRRNAARIVFQHSSHVHDSFALRWPGCAFYLATEKVYVKALLVFSLLAPVHPEHFARKPHGARPYRTLTIPSHAASPIIPYTCVLLPRRHG